LDLDLIVLFPTITRNDSGHKVHTPVPSLFEVLNVCMKHDLYAL